MASEDCDILETRISKGVDNHCIYIWTGKYLMSESTGCSIWKVTKVNLYILYANNGKEFNRSTTTYLENFNLPGKYVLFLTKAMLYQICPLFKQTSNMTLGVRGNLPPGTHNLLIEMRFSSHARKVLLGKK